MRLMSKPKWFVGFFVAVFLAFAGSQSAGAQSISFHPLKYGTNQTSMADGYFVKPANVIVKNHLYYVTMQIKTAKSLSSYPVKVLWVNGRAPLNVRRAKDHAGNSHVYYSFYSKNLAKRVNAKLAIDVPKVYKARHLISFKFSTRGLPSLGQRHKTVAPIASSESNKTVKTSSSTQPKQSSNKASGTSNVQKKQAPKVKKKAKTNKRPQQTPKKSSSSQPSASSQQSTEPAKQSSSKPHAKKSGVPWIVGCVTLIAGISAGTWIYFRH